MYNSSIMMYYDPNMIHVYSIHKKRGEGNIYGNIMYNSIEIDGLPFWKMDKMVTFHGYVTNKQMVS